MEITVARNADEILSLSASMNSTWPRPRPTGARIPSNIPPQPRKDAIPKYAMMGNTPRDPAQDCVGPQQMPIGQRDDRAPQQRAHRRPHLRREVRISEDSRSPGLLATRRERRVIEERDIAARDHAEGDPHGEVVEEEARVTAPQRREGKADGLERRAQQQRLLPSPQVREQP